MNMANGETQDGSTMTITPIHPHPLGGFISSGGRDLLRARRDIPSSQRPVVGHHHPLGDRSRHCLRHVLLRTARHGGAVCQAGSQDRLAWAGRLRPAQPLAGGDHGLQLRRSLHPAARGDRVAGVVQAWMGMFNGPAGTFNLGALPTIWTLTGTDLHPRRPAVRHRDVPCRHPAALGGRTSCRSRRCWPRSPPCSPTRLSRKSRYRWGWL